MDVVVVLGYSCGCTLRKAFSGDAITRQRTYAAFKWGQRWDFASGVVDLHNGINALKLSGVGHAQMLRWILLENIVLAKV